MSRLYLATRSTAFAGGALLGFASSAYPLPPHPTTILANQSIGPFRKVWYSIEAQRLSLQKKPPLPEGQGGLFTFRVRMLEGDDQQVLLLEEGAEV